MPAVARRCLLLALLAIALPGFAFSMDKEQALAKAKTLLAQRAPQMGLQASDLEDLIVTDTYATKHNQVTHIYLRQRLDGIELVNGTLTLNLDRGGQLVSAGNRFVANFKARVNTSRPSLDREEAIRWAAEGLELTVAEPLSLIEDLGGATREGLFTPAGISLDPITIKLAYYATPAGAVQLSWEMLIRQPDQQHWWHLWLDATTGEILAKVDWIARDSYQALEIPLEDPGEDGVPFDEDRTIIVDPADAIASPFGWHDTDGSPGPEFTDTRGNNVNAQQDRDGNNTGGAPRPSGGASLDFAAAMDLSTDNPVDYTDAAVINLFYWNNILHDVLYQYGFDEPSGNFQENSYGNGGLGSDPVEADAQDNADGSPPSANNANFSTPPDSSSPRMQMFEWTSPFGQLVTVNLPAGIAGSYIANPSNNGGTGNGLTADLAIVVDGVAPTTDACDSVSNDLTGKIALIVWNEGACNSSVFVANAADAGAVAAVIVDNTDQPFTNFGGSSQIPSVAVGKPDGDLFIATIGGGETVNATLEDNPQGQLNRDSDFDNGIIAHEYCHGLSNRLTGGPAITSCLYGDQQAGEGWSDLCTLFFGAKPSDTPTAGRGIGNYVLSASPNGPGVRLALYSTDLGVNPLTYGDLAGAPGNGIAIPHGVGTVWATAAWEVYWNLVGSHGFDADLYAGTGGNNLWFQLIVDGMKLQPCGPTFLDARDAILAADVANNAGANECAIWNGFAKRGMGLSAADGGSALSLAVTEAFDTPAQCAISCPGDQTVAGTDTGVVTHRAVNSLTFGPSYEATSSSTVTAKAGVSIRFDNGVAIGGFFSAVLTPTPCS